MSVFDTVVKLAQTGEQAGVFLAEDGNVKSTDQGEKHVECALILRPDVPMQQVMGIPYVVAYGLAEALEDAVPNIGIAWPYGIVIGDTPVASIRAHAGYADGMFVVYGLTFDFEEFPEVGELLATGALSLTNLAQRAMATVGSWAENVKAGRAAAGPLAPILNEYFERVTLLGQTVDVVYPNGNVAYTAHFGGVDVWGRAIIVDGEGKETAITPEQASIRASR